MTKAKTLSAEDVKHVAKLANLQLTDMELEKFRPQLAGIIDLIGQLKKLPTAGEEMTSQVTGLINVFREDVIDLARQLTQDEALKNAKKTHNGFFLVPKIIEQS